MTSDLDNVKRLLNLGIGDRGRLEHIKQAIEKNNTLYTSDKEYLKKLIQNFPAEQIESDSNNRLEKSIGEKSPKEIPLAKNLSEIFCSSCGNGLSRNSKFCSKCGNEIQSKPTLPKQEVKISKSQSMGYKFSIIVGVIGILGGFSMSNNYNVLIGISLVIIGFVSLKNKSKSIDQFLSIVSFILFAIIIINWIKI